jgi:hypothetical protein
LRASGINWSGPDVQTTARGFVQQMLATYVAAYQRLGNSALVVYHDVTAADADRSKDRRNCSRTLPC